MRVVIMQVVWTLILLSSLVACEVVVGKVLHKQHTRAASRARKRNKLPLRGSYLNVWAVTVHGDEEMARKVAGKNGFINKGKVYEDVFEFVHRGVPRRRKRASFVKTMHLIKDTRVVWAQQQQSKVKEKRELKFDDTWWREQWYLHKTKDAVFAGEHHLNVMPVWKRGITGKGVVIAVLDDGLEYTHPEISPNYDPKASYDYNENDTDPSPTLPGSSHGTRCAGVAAAAANNSNCIVGVAYEAKIGGIRMLDGEITDIIEAQSLSHARDYIDIYSSSWGPLDDGETVEGPGPLTEKALENGVKFGRGGKGSIVVWASGNGGKPGDNCNCDGYTNSIYTISVSAVSSLGVRPSYSESCASTLVSAYSSGSAQAERQILTVDVNHGCTDMHTGTSVAPPLVSGLVAFALQVNPELTWRDVQHLLVGSSTLHHLKDNDDFTRNSGGKMFSHHFGFGTVNAERLVDMAEHWPPVGEQHSCYHKKRRRYPHNRFNNTKPLVITFNTSACAGTPQTIRYIEHVHIISTFYHYRRGATEIEVTSPSGTKSWILRSRPKDIRGGEFKNWKFLSTHFWGENPHGVWTVKFSSTELPYQKGSSQGFLEEVKLVIYGTTQKPGVRQKKVEEKPIKCHELCVHGCTAPTNSDCSECVGYYYMKDDKQHCVKSCPAHTFTLDEDGVECLACHSSCSHCDGELATDCLSCPSSHVFYLGSCVKQCPGGHFKERDNYNKEGYFCRKCNKLCASCTGSADQCTSCNEVSQLIGSTCVALCKEHVWLDGEVCRDCHTTCKTCNGAGAHNCTSCPKKALQDQQDSYLYKGECVSDCPVSTYQDNTMHGHCLDCSSNCLKCSNEGRECQVCAVDHYLAKNEKVMCVKQCPKGFYTNEAGRQCEYCDYQCASCVPGNSEACTSCFEGFYLKGAACVKETDCNINYYGNTTSARCNICHEGCEKCDSADKCTKCKTAFLKYKLTPDHQCVQMCPRGTFVNNDVQCASCHANCLECDGENEDSCTKCQQGWALCNGKCVTEIPSGYYAEKIGDMIQCKRCHHTCRECNGPSQCTACIGNLDRREDTCVNPCPRQYLGKNSCENCHPRCSSCFGPSKQHCLKCNGNFSLNTDSFTCTKACPRKFFQDPSTFICTPCHPSCSSCTGPKANQCKKCKEGLKLHNNTCVMQCPDSHYVKYDSADMLCQPCNSACKRCHIKPDLCVKCPPGQILYHYKCYSECPANKFYQEEDKLCHSCHQSCKSCKGTSPDMCTSCYHGYTLHEGMCIKGCLPGFHRDNTDETCKPCAKDCIRCHKLEEENTTVCTRCSNTTFLHDATCVDTCPQQYHAHPTDNVCLACPSPGCLECPSGKTCSKCHPLFENVDGQCKNTCPKGFSADLVTSDCVQCNENCVSCTSSHQCTVCKESVLQIKKHDGSVQCVEECPAQHYQSGRECKECHAFCASCSDEHSCETCIPSMVKLNSTCVAECPEGYTNTSNTCKRCSDLLTGCQKCDRKRCFECQSPLIVSHVGTCAESCSPTYFNIDNKCASCMKDSCIACNETGCTACEQGLTVVNGSCVLLCAGGVLAVNNSCPLVATTTTSTTTETTTQTIPTTASTSKKTLNVTATKKPKTTEEASEKPRTTEEASEVNSTATTTTINAEIHITDNLNVTTQTSTRPTEATTSDVISTNPVQRNATNASGHSTQYPPTISTEAIKDTKISTQTVANATETKISNKTYPFSTQPTKNVSSKEKVTEKPTLPTTATTEVRPSEKITEKTTLPTTTTTTERMPTENAHEKSEDTRNIIEKLYKRDSQDNIGSEESPSENVHRIVVIEGGFAPSAKRSRRSVEEETPAPTGVRHSTIVGVCSFTLFGVLFLVWLVVSMRRRTDQCVS